MRKILKNLKITYRNVLKSIAFYPVLISILCLILAAFALSVENSKIIQSLKEDIPHIFIQDFETARSILSVFISGIISLTVFSFSMVMVVLSQASANFSPRLLPDLIANKRHQIILGTYIGTLLYCIIILTSLGARGIDANTMGLSVAFSALLSLICIGLFVYFIHSISKAIQIHNIIERIHENCNAYAENLLDVSNDSKIPLQYIDTSDWTVLHSNQTGYYKGFDNELMKKSIEEQDNQIEIIPHLNQHLWEGMPILRVKKDMPKNDIENLVLCIEISSDRHEDDQGIGGMIKLMEIAVKAMSPGINDPGTAIDSINKLGQLLAKFLQFPRITSQPIENGNFTLVKNNIPASELMKLVIQPIRLYSKKDSSVLFQIIGALKFIESKPRISDENKKAVLEEFSALKIDIEANIDNLIDRKSLLKALE